MPNFDELSVKELWPQMFENEEFMKYFPTPGPSTRLPCRTYFFNIMNTLMGEYVRQIMTHAQTVRANKSHMLEAVQTIEVTDEWFDKLKAVPFVSCKFNSLTNSL